MNSVLFMVQAVCSIFLYIEICCAFMEPSAGHLTNKQTNRTWIDGSWIGPGLLMNLLLGGSIQKLIDFSTFESILPSHPYFYMLILLDLWLTTSTLFKGWPSASPSVSAFRECLRAPRNSQWKVSKNSKRSPTRSQKVCKSPEIFRKKKIRRKKKTQKKSTKTLQKLFFFRPGLIKYGDNTVDSPPESRTESDALSSKSESLWVRLSSRT